MTAFHSKAASPELKELYASECQSCGMCCIFYAYYKFCLPVETDGPEPPKKLIQIGPRRGEANLESINRYLRIIPDSVWKGFSRCVALSGVQGSEVFCAVYDSRPAACRSYDPGSADCLAVRAWGNLEPLQDGYGLS